MKPPSPYNKPQKRQSKKALVETIIGLIIGVLTPAFAAAVLLEFYPKLPAFSEIDHSTFVFLTTRVLMFSVIINAGLFFGGLRLKRDGISRGILFACLLLIIGVVYFKFIA